MSGEVYTKSPDGKLVLAKANGIFAEPSRPTVLPGMEAPAVKKTTDVPNSSTESQQVRLGRISAMMHGASNYTCER